MSEFKVLVSQLDYKAPNSFEEALQVMWPLYSQRTGLCYKKSVVVNNPCNKVQVENENIAGNISIEELNEKYLDGFVIDFLEYQDIENKSAHQELPIQFIKEQ
jgi:hypothetical protein